MSVYFIAIRSRPQVKIGFAVDPKKRLSELLIGWPTDELSLAAVIPGDKVEESVIHKHFKHRRVRGEWFERDAELDAVVDLALKKRSLDALAWFSDGVEERRAKLARLGRAGEDAAALARNVKRLRIELGLTQSALAREAGIPRPTAAYLEKGFANPTLAVLAAIAGALGVQLQELLVRE